MSFNENRILKTGVAQYREATYDGQNHSGFDPVNDKVLVLTDQVSEETEGGIKLPAEVIERSQMAAETGVIVAMGQGAFRYSGDRSMRWEGRRPCPGDRVYVERYAGQILFGIDGVKYRLMDDKCIGAVRPSELSTDSEQAELARRLGNQAAAAA